MNREIDRALQPIAADAARARRVLVLSGPRQSGKTTLARRLVDAAPHSPAFRSLDDPTQLSLAQSDPTGFIRTGPRPMVIDEIQRGGDSLVLAIKSEVDANRAPGQFVLTGSADFLTVPTISESLAGRVSIHTVWPFTQGEIDGRAETWIDSIFGGDLGDLIAQPAHRFTRESLIDRVVRGGFPEVQILNPRQRRQWFSDYLDSVIRRDIVELGGIRRAEQLRRMLGLFAARTGSEVVMESVLADLDVQRQAGWSYAAWLRTVFLIHDVPAWSANLTSRVIKRPKTIVCDSGLAAYLLGRNEKALADPREPTIGPLVETFVANEVIRAATWAETAVRIYHVRRADQMEVDLVLEADDGKVVAIEVKSGQAVTSSSFRGLTRLRDEIGGAFVAGLVLYAGEQKLSFGDRLAALPISTLWA